MKAKLARAVEELVAAEPRFAPVVARAGPCTLRRNRAFSAFASVASAIVGQQLSPAAAKTIEGRIPRLFGRADFPSPEEVLAAPPELLRSAGLSGMKVAALRDLAAKVKDGTVPSSDRLHRMDDEEVVAALTAVRGVGRWTAEMLLIFDLGRLDVLPLGDYGVRRGAGLLFGLRTTPDEKRLARLGAAWRPWRTVASWYLWRRIDRAAWPDA